MFMSSSLRSSNDKAANGCGVPLYDSLCAAELLLQNLVTRANGGQ